MSAEWQDMSAWQRNWLIGSLMKAEPMRAFYLRWQGKDFAQLRTKDAADAERWLRIAKGGELQWKTLVDEVPWTAREEVTIHVDEWHVRYSDTPGGGWIVIEWLRLRGAVNVASIGEQWRIAHERCEVAVTAPTMAEAACRMALNFT